VVDTIQLWLEAHPAWTPWATIGGMILLNALALLFARNLLARGIVYLSGRTKTRKDDILVQHLRPYRLAWIAPLLVTYTLAPWFPAAAGIIRTAMLLGILWLVVITLNALLNAANVIYESGSAYHGISIQGYLDLGKIMVIAVGVILSAASITGQSPAMLLSGLGAVTAILLLIFHDTLLSFVASIQIQSHDLVREGDWIEMPAYNADGTVTNIALHTIKVQNWDNATTVVPTHKLLDTPYRNWRGMEESGGRRIKRALYIDLNSVRFCDAALVERFRQNDMVRDYIEQRIAQAAAASDRLACRNNVCEEHQLTNVGVFRAYMTEYLNRRPDLHHGDMALLVRQLDPGPSGVPLEVYAFTKTVTWEEYEAVQADIFEHLLAAAPQFGLRVFQTPSGTDFQALLDAQG